MTTSYKGTVYTEGGNVKFLTLEVVRHCGPRRHPLFHITQVFPVLLDMVFLDGSHEFAWS